MKPALPTPPLMIITNRHMSADLVTTVERALDGGARWILLREKDLAPPKRLRLAGHLKAATDRCGALLGINSDLAAAQAIGAANIHLPAAALNRPIEAPRRLLGASVHDAEEAERALEIGADYLLLGPIFETPSKLRQRPPIGLAGLRALAAAVPVPVIALGGIGPDRAAACLEAGAAGVAAMGAIMRADDPTLVVRAFLEAMSR